MPADSTVGDTASWGSWTKPCGDALQAAEAVEFILESNTHDLSVFLDHDRTGMARPEHAKKKNGLPMNMSISLTSPTTDFEQHPSFALLMQVFVCGRFTEQRWRDHSSPPEMAETLFSTVLHNGTREEQFKPCSSYTGVRNPAAYSHVHPLYNVS